MDCETSNEKINDNWELIIDAGIQHYIEKVTEKDESGGKTQDVDEPSKDEEPTSISKELKLELSSENERNGEDEREKGGEGEAEGEGEGEDEDEGEEEGENELPEDKPITLETPEEEDKRETIQTK